MAPRRKDTAQLSNHETMCPRSQNRALCTGMLGSRFRGKSWRGFQSVVRFILGPPGFLAARCESDSVEVRCVTRVPVPRILCVDDNEELLAVARDLLVRSGYSVLTASSGRCGLEVLGQSDVDAVVLDYEMPGMSGEEVARSIRRLKPSVPILLFTGYADVIPDRILGCVDKVVSKSDPSGLLKQLARLVKA